MAKAAEKLMILVESGDGVMTRLHQVKESLQKNKPVFLIDPPFKSILTAMLKKFPEPPRLEGVPGFELLVSNSQKYVDQLQVFYETFLDVMRWKDLAFSCLCEVSSSTCALSVMANPFLTYRFLEVVSLFIRLHLFLANIPDRKPVLSVYGKCYELVRSELAPDFAKLCLYICEYENPFKRILAVFQPLSSRIAQALVGLKPVLDKVLNLQTLRKDGALSVTLNPHHLAIPAAEQFDFDVVLTTQFHDWVLFGLLFTPEEFKSQKELMALTRTVLQQTFVGQIFRDENMYIHKEYENLFTTYKSPEKELTKMLRKEKKTIGECLNLSVGQGARHHRQMRAYVRQELEALICMIEEFPGLIGPKFQTIMHALTMARDEILWFFRHKTSQPPQGITKKYYFEDEYRDPHLIVLLDRMMHLKRLVRANKRVIQTYYLEFLHGQDCKRIKELVASNTASMSPGKVEMDSLTSIIQELEAIDVRAFMQGSAEYDFRTLRLNWYRVESSMSLTTAPVSIVMARDLSLKFHMIIWHSRNVDEIDKMLDEFTSLSSLYFYKTALFPELDIILTTCRHPSALAAVFDLLNELPLSANQYNPQDRPLIGEECVQYADRFLKTMADRIGIYLMMCADEYVKFDHQTDYSAAAWNMLTSNQIKVAGDVPVTPGSESLYKNKIGLVPVKLSLSRVWALCILMQKNESVVVFDTKFYPREYLRDKLNIIYRMMIRKCLDVEVNKEIWVHKPSHIERELHSYRNLLMSLENFVDLNIADIIREAWLEEAFNEVLQHQVAPEAAFGWVSIEPLKGLTETMVGKVVSFYVNTFQAKVLTPPAVGSIIYSEICQSFFSKVGFPFQAQEYFNVVELMALARLGGPYAFRLLDRELLRLLLPYLQQIISHVQANQAFYDEIEKGAGSVQIFEAVTKKIRDFDSFAQTCINLGSVLAFRRIARRALHAAARGAVPEVVAVTTAAYNEYSRNTLLSPSLLPTDSIADYCGIDAHIVDQSLAHLIKKYALAEPAVINLLPTVFASLAFSRIVQESLYLKQFEAHTTNASVLPFTFAQLLFSLKAVSSSAPQVEVEIVALKKKYVEMSALIVVSLSKLSPSELRSTRFVSLPSLASLLDMFIEASPLITREFLEPILPYTLMRAMYKECYAMVTPKGW